MPTFSSPKPAEPEGQPIGSSNSCEIHPIAFLPAPLESSPVGGARVTPDREFWCSSYLGRELPIGSRMITESNVLLLSCSTSIYCSRNDGSATAIGRLTEEGGEIEQHVVGHLSVFHSSNPSITLLRFYPVGSSQSNCPCGCQRSERGLGRFYWQDDLLRVWECGSLRQLWHGPIIIMRDPSVCQCRENGVAHLTPPPRDTPLDLRACPLCPRLIRIARQLFHHS